MVQDSHVFEFLRPTAADSALNEENTKLRFITPVIQSRWNITEIDMEFAVGKILVDSTGHTHRGDGRKADYLLCYTKDHPLAIVEAKRCGLSADVGMQQAMDYAKDLDVPFAYATNGDDLIEYDLLTGATRRMKMPDLPSRDELWERFQIEADMPKGIVQPYLYPYYSDDDKKPRYYQRIIINKVIEAVLRGRKKMLVVCATGTGKTYEAFQIIWRLWKSGLKKRVLFLADRNSLIDQTMNQDFAPFGENMTKFDNSRFDIAHPIYLSTYQQLITTRDGQIEYHYKKFPCDFFDLVIVDECHRSSANQDSSWHEILDYFSDATQIGMTATPKDDADPNRSNIAYFGEPIYTYSLKQGIEDGFLAPFRIAIPKINIDEGWIPDENVRDENGRPIIDDLEDDEELTQRDYDTKVAVTDRHRTIAEYVTNYLVEHDMRYAKTIVFCENIQHAYAMAQALREQNQDLCAEDERYVTTIVAGEKNNTARLEEFTAVGSAYPVIAVTSRLMSTGVDAKTCKVIVLDRSIGSMTEFKQIIGRGTRVKKSYTVNGRKESKEYFTIIDFRSNYEKFQDPEFDGVPVSVTVEGPGTTPTGGENGPIDEGPEDGGKKGPVHRIARVSGVDVEITDEVEQWLDEHGKPTDTPLEAAMGEHIRERYSTLEAFTADWVNSADREALTKELMPVGDWEQSFRDRYGYPVDMYDIICDFGFHVTPPANREERAHGTSAEAFIAQSKFNDQQRAILRLFTDLYAVSGIENLHGDDAIKALDMQQFSEAGFSPRSAVKQFGSRSQFLDTLAALERSFYEDGVEVTVKQEGNPQ